VIQVRGQAHDDALARHEDPALPAWATLRGALRACALGALAASLLAPAAPAAAPAAAAAASAAPDFGFESVRALARELAQQPYRAGENEVPQYLLDLDYDAHRDIRFKPPRSIWRAEKLPFQLQFFHLGLFFNRRVAINLVEDGVAKPFPFDASLFDYGRNRFPEPLPADLGYAGFRAHSRINRPDYFDEVIVFVGASYFRAVAKDLRYGLSARGVAVDTAIDGPEEFPYFKEFWIVEPAPRAKELVVYALLDGPSLSGAYRFAVEPGKETVAAVQATLFARSRPGRLGLAPLTSMFWHAENSETDFGDFRPRVHDSDGLLMHAGSGEWIWRPLRNPMRLELSAFQDRNPRGFGLLQRERDFAFYQDLEARYEDRPSAWVEPVGEWGAGSVVLIEMPSDIETNDNIVALWEPKDGIRPGEPLDLAYRLHWYEENAAWPPRGRTIATRIGAIHDSEDTRFVIDFGQGELSKLAPGADVTANVSASPGGVVSDVVTHRNEFTRGWRVAFRLASEDADEPVELRCFLATQGRVLTETWSYRWTP
jgi:glucans biosynthesis protein